MKKAFPFLLAILICIAYNFETIKVVSKVIGAKELVYVDDVDCEENNEDSADSKEKNEKSEKSDFFDDFNASGVLISAELELVSLYSKQNHKFSSSDYSQVVYSPPEMA